MKSFCFIALALLFFISTVSSSLSDIDDDEGLPGLPDIDDDDKLFDYYLKLVRTNGGDPLVVYSELCSRNLLTDRFKEKFRKLFELPEDLFIPRVDSTGGPSVTNPEAALDLQNPGLRSLLSTPEGRRQFIERFPLDQRSQIMEQLEKAGISIPQDEKMRKRGSGTSPTQSRISPLQAVGIISASLAALVMLFLVVYTIRRRSSQVLLSSSADSSNPMV